MNPEHGIFEDDVNKENVMINLDEVNWARVNVIYKMLSMAGWDNGEQVQESDLLQTNELKEQYDNWLVRVSQVQHVELEIGMRMMFGNIEFRDKYREQLAEQFGDGYGEEMLLEESWNKQ